MTQQLPLFEGRTVHGAQLKVNATGNARTAYHHGDELYLVVRGSVVEVNHVDKDGVMVRAHKLVATAVRELPEEMSPEQILADAAKLAEETSDQPSLDFDPEG